MFNSNSIIVGLEIGTSKICAVVGEVSDEGALNIVRRGEARSRGVRTREIEDPQQAADDGRTAAVDGQGQLWIVLQTGHVYVYDRAGEKQRVVTFGGALSDLPSSLFFTSRNRVLVGPGGYEFEAASGSSPVAR